MNWNNEMKMSLWHYRNAGFYLAYTQKSALNTLLHVALCTPLWELQNLDITFFVVDC